MELIAVPAFADNLIWVLHDGLQAVVVDPGSASPVVEALQERNLRLAAILVTHHHPDHVGGLRELSAWAAGQRQPNASAAPFPAQDPHHGNPAPGLPIFGPAREAMPVEVRRLAQGDHFELLGAHVEVLDVPGHTAGHIAYVVTVPGQAPWLFCGDTMFSGGCGRLFEGTPVQMLDSLTRLAELPGDTRVCSAHEYTLSNLRFARTVEPNNVRLAEYEACCQALRAEGAWTLPSTIATERAVNPFLRTAEPEVAASARAQGAATNELADVFATLREWKNRF